MKKKILISLITIGALALAGWMIYGQYGPKDGEENIIKEPFNEEAPENTAPELSREKIIQDVKARISELSPDEAVLGGKWYVLRFWFTKDNENFYAEYEDGHIMRQILIHVIANDVDKNGGEPQYKYDVVALFEPDENGWTLKSGQDILFGQELELVESDN